MCSIFWLGVSGHLGPIFYWATAEVSTMVNPASRKYTPPPRPSFYNDVKMPEPMTRALANYGSNGMETHVSIKVVLNILKVLQEQGGDSSMPVSEESKAKYSPLVDPLTSLYKYSKPNITDVLISTISPALGLEGAVMAGISSTGGVGIAAGAALLAGSAVAEVGNHVNNMLKRVYQNKEIHRELEEKGQALVPFVATAAFGGHAMVAKITRKEDGEHKATIYNLGAGIDKHHPQAGKGKVAPKTVHLEGDPARIAKNVSLENSKHIPGAVSGPVKLVAWVGSNMYYSATGKEKPSSVDRNYQTLSGNQEARVFSVAHSPQESGSCVWHSPEAFLQDALPPHEHHMLKTYMRAIAYHKTLEYAEKRHGVKTYEDVEAKLNQLKEKHGFSDEQLSAKKSIRAVGGPTLFRWQLRKARSLYKTQQTLEHLSRKYETSLDKIHTASQHHNGKPIDIITKVPGEPEATGAFLYHNAYKTYLPIVAHRYEAEKLSTLMAAQCSMLPQDGDEAESFAEASQALSNGQALMQQCGEGRLYEKSTQRSIFRAFRAQLQLGQTVALPVIIQTNADVVVNDGDKNKTVPEPEYEKALMEIQRQDRGQYCISHYRAQENPSDQGGEHFTVTTHENVSLTESQIRALLLSTTDKLSCAKVKQIMDEQGIGSGAATEIPEYTGGDMLNAYVIHRSACDSQQMATYEKAYLEKHLDIVKADLAAYEQEAENTGQHVYVRTGRVSVATAINKHTSLSRQLSRKDTPEAISPSRRSEYLSVATAVRDRGKISLVSTPLGVQKDTLKYLELAGSAFNADQFKSALLARSVLSDIGPNTRPVLIPEDFADEGMLQQTGRLFNQAADLQREAIELTRSVPSESDATQQIISKETATSTLRQAERAEGVLIPLMTTDDNAKPQQSFSHIQEQDDGTLQASLYEHESNGTRISRFALPIGQWNESLINNLLQPPAPEAADTPLARFQRGNTELTVTTDVVDAKSPLGAFLHDNRNDQNGVKCETRMKDHFELQSRTVPTPVKQKPQPDKKPLEKTPQGLFTIKPSPGSGNETGASHQSLSLNQTSMKGLIYYHAHKHISVRTTEPNNTGWLASMMSLQQSILERPEATDKLLDLPIQALKNGSKVTNKLFQSLTTSGFNDSDRSNAGGKAAWTVQSLLQKGEAVALPILIKSAESGLPAVELLELRLSGNDDYQVKYIHRQAPNEQGEQMVESFHHNVNFTTADIQTLLMSTAHYADSDKATTLLQKTLTQGESGAVKQYWGTDALQAYSVGNSDAAVISTKEQAHLGAQLKAVDEDLEKALLGAEGTMTVDPASKSQLARLFQQYAAAAEIRVHQGERRVARMSDKSMPLPIVPAAVNEVANVAEVIQAGYFVSGRDAAQLQQYFSDYLSTTSKALDSARQNGQQSQRVMGDPKAGDGLAGVDLSGPGSAIAQTAKQLLQASRMQHQLMHEGERGRARVVDSIQSRVEAGGNVLVPLITCKGDEHQASLVRFQKREDGNVRATVYEADSSCGKVYGYLPITSEQWGEGYLQALLQYPQGTPLQALNNPQQPTIPVVEQTLEPSQLPRQPNVGLFSGLIGRLFSWQNPTPADTYEVIKPNQPMPYEIPSRVLAERNPVDLFIKDMTKLQYSAAQTLIANRCDEMNACSEGFSQPDTSAVQREAVFKGLRQEALAASSNA
ncbi:MAG: hypothetical protein ACJAUP_001361 [Cellvibrionaceae bacterium]|jgi:hypothetical protein